MVGEAALAQVAVDGHAGLGVGGKVEHRRDPKPMGARSLGDVLLLSAIGLQELEAVDLVLVAVLGKLRLRAEVDVQVLLRVALRTATPAVLCPRCVAAAETNVQRCEALLPFENRDPILGWQVLVRRAPGAVQLVVVEDEVVPAVVVGVVLADTPVQERADRVVAHQRVEEGADPIGAPDELALDRRQHVAAMLDARKGLRDGLVAVVRHRPQPYLGGLARGPPRPGGPLGPGLLVLGQQLVAVLVDPSRCGELVDAGLAVCALASAACRAGDHARRGLMLTAFSEGGRHERAGARARTRGRDRDARGVAMPGIPTAALDRPSAVMGHVGQGLDQVPVSLGVVVAADRRDPA